MVNKCSRLKGNALKSCKMKNWIKLEKQKYQPNTEMWGNKEKGGMVFVSKLKYPEGVNKWRVGGTNARGFIKETYLESKPKAKQKAKEYMETH